MFKLTNLRQKIGTGIGRNVPACPKIVSMQFYNRDCNTRFVYFQTISTADKLVSRLSEPVVVSWPGVVAPALRQSALNSGVVRISWDRPTITGGADVKQATVCLSVCLSVCIIVIHFYRATVMFYWRTPVLTLLLLSPTTKGIMQCLLSLSVCVCLWTKKMWRDFNEIFWIDRKRNRNKSLT